MGSGHSHHGLPDFPSVTDEPSQLLDLLFSGTEAVTYGSLGDGGLDDWLSRYPDCPTAKSEGGLDLLWCHTFSDDYNQVFVLAAVLYLIHLGCSLILYPLLGRFAINSDRERLNQMWVQRSMQADDRSSLSDWLKEQTTIGGWSLTTIVVMSCVQSILCLAAKFVLYYSTDLDGLSYEFNHRSFHNFINPRTIILSGLFLHSIGNMNELNQSVVYILRQPDTSDIVKTFVKLCRLVQMADVITSIVFVCIRYALVVYALYAIAVALLVGCVFAVSCCVTIPVGLCAMASVVGLFRLVARVLTCGKLDDMPSISNLITQIGAAIVFHALGYLALCLFLVFAFLLPGGPTSSCIYLDSNDSSAMTVAGLLLATVVIGVAMTVVGFLRAVCCSRNADYERVDEHDTRFEPV